jgi:hypothetical protein
MDAAEIAVFAKRRGIDPDEFIADALGSGLYADDSEPVDTFADRAAAFADAFADTFADAVADAVAAPVEDQNKGLDDMDRGELRAAARDLGLGQGGSKDELRARIRVALADETTDATALSVSSDTRATVSATDEEAPEA